MIPHGVAQGKYVSLTTFRKDGTPVATPIWFAVDGDELVMWTRADSWKVKRLRRNTRVLVAPCDVRGRVAAGTPAVEGTGRLVEDLARVRRLLARKYSWQFWLIDVPATLWRRGRRPHVGIAVRFGAAPQSGANGPGAAEPGTGPGPVG